jgi:hypothetical protein
MRYIKVLSTAMLAVMALSCGGEGPLGGPGDALARVGDSYITVDDFREVFSELSPEDQVAVLDPGGRLGLVDRLVNKKVLELATDSLELSGVDWWRSLYREADLSRQYAAGMAEQARNLAADTTGRPEENWFSMDIVLVDDSAAAAEVARSWESERPSAPDTSMMALAPWSRGGSSFRTLENYVALMPEYLRETVLEHANEGVSVEPIFGAYAVFSLRTTEPEDPMTVESAIPVMLSNMIYSEAELRPSSRGIEGFIEGLRQEAGSYVPGGELTGSGDTLVTYESGALTAGEAAEVFHRLRRDNFLAEPEELSWLMPPRPTGRNRSVDIWMYLTSLARLEWQAGRAEEEGMEPDTGLLRMAEVEHLLRTMVIDSLRSVDDSVLQRFYTDNIQQYTMPERRVVLRADIPAADTAGVSELASLRDLQAEGDSPIRLSLSPPLAEGAFGAIGSEVFEADTSGVHGPIVQADTLPLVYFQVMAVLPDSVLEAAGIMERIRHDYVRQNADRRLDELIMELRRAYDVEIDSAAVKRVDPW